MSYALFLAFCSMGSPMLLMVPRPYVPLPHALLCYLLLSMTVVSFLGFCSLPFYLGYSPIELWDSLSAYVHPGIACLAS